MSSKEFELIMARLDRIEERLDKDRDPILTVEDISKILGKSPGYLRGDGRWMLPNKGHSEFPGRKLRFRKSSFEKWRTERGF